MSLLLTLGSFRKDGTTLANFVKNREVRRAVALGGKDGVFVFL